MQKGDVFFCTEKLFFCQLGQGLWDSTWFLSGPIRRLSQCPSVPVISENFSESLCSSEFRSRYAPRNFGVAITLDHSPPLKWISKVGPLSMDLAIDVIDLAGAPIRMRASWTSLMSSPEYRAMTPPLAESIHRGGARPPAAFGIGTERGATRKRWSRSVSASLGDVGTLMTRVSAY